MVPPEKADRGKKKCFCGSPKCRGFFYWWSIYWSIWIRIVLANSCFQKKVCIPTSSLSFCSLGGKYLFFPCFSSNAHKFTELFQCITKCYVADF
jgi:hypothetical protein